MKPEKLTDIKKELSGKNVQELTDLCLRLAKYKKENIGTHAPPPDQKHPAPRTQPTPTDARLKEVLPIADGDG